MSKINYDLENKTCLHPGDMKIVIRINEISYEIGHLFSYSLQTTKEVIPVQVFGNKFSNAAIPGRRAHDGVLIFNVINESLIQELKEELFRTNNSAVKDGGFTSEISGLTFDEQGFEEADDDLIRVNTNPDRINAMDLPPFDLIITTKHPTNPKIYYMKKIIGITLVSQNGAIGLDTITTQDQYAFMCKSVTPMISYETDSIGEFNDVVNELIKQEDDSYVGTIGIS